MKYYGRKGSSIENYTSNNPTQHETTRDNTSATRDNTSRERHSINFILIYLHHHCILGTWYIKAKALLTF